MYLPRDEFITTTMKWSSSRTNDHAKRLYACLELSGSRESHGRCYTRDAIQEVPTVRRMRAGEMPRTEPVISLVLARHK